MSMLPISITKLVKYKPNTSDDFLIGRGFLSRSGSVLVCGEPGCGKSKLTQHAIYAFALGLPFLGFVPTRKLRVLYVQNEDTLDDMHECLVGFRLQQKLTPAQVTELDRQCVIVNSVGLSGDKFVEALDDCIRKYKPDIVVTDPLLAFIGCDLTNQAKVTEFLREKMAPLMQANRCGWICVHHSSKGAAGGGYGGSKVNKALGSIEVSAFFRGIIDLERKRADANQCTLEITKRFKQAGLRSADGKLTNRLNLRCGEESISWEVDHAVAPVAVKAVGRPGKADKPEVEAFIAERRKAGDKNPTVVKAVAKEFGYSLKQARRYVQGKA